jgi:NAD(P)-dependent dehydrogenase (short-subunit alcohol dehydrogenase family)
MTSLSGARTLITGAAGGIGRSTALRAARDGAVVFLTDRDAAGLQETAALVREHGGRLLGTHAVDVSDYEAVQAMADQAHAEHGSFDVVMNVAGISTWGTVDRLTHDDWRRLVDVNLMGPIHVIEAFIPPMIAAGRGGHLVNVSSAAGLFGLPWHAAYSATKFGVRGVSEVLRFDLRQHGIRVSLVCPGAVATPLVDSVRIVGVDRDDPQVRALTQRFTRHAVTPDQAAEAIIRGVRRNRFWVYTSRDIAFGHFAQRKFEWPYTLVMRALNARVRRVLDRSGAADPRDREPVA